MDFDISRTDLKNLIEEWIFSERNRVILKRKLLDGVTYEQLSEEFDLSVSQIKTIVSKGKNVLRTKGGL